MKDKYKDTPPFKGGQGRSDEEIEEAGENTFWLILTCVAIAAMLAIFGGA